MRKLLLILFSISAIHFSGISQNVFPTTGNASLYSFNYLKTGYMYLQFPPNTSNNYTRGILGQDIYWDNSNTIWQIPNTSQNDFSLLRFENGGDIGFYGSASTGAAYTMTDAQLNATCKMLISASGKIGIGTKLPQALLHVNGNVLIGTPTTTNLYSTPSSYMLDVKGNIRANQLTVNTTGADFVFEPSYKLKSLKELETFVMQNHRLPEVEPAIDMQKNGVNIGDNQTKLLQKIEELTLYLFSQNKQMEKKDEEIGSLKEVIKTMLERLDKLENKK